ncbi:MAG: type I methionyl aminopeptidase [Oscillospiraceae bacterium]|jgi:methionyl aminopeptidase|nr:type I methionyl aminopeptidase [Oscillospiraceae bacterium]
MIKLRTPREIELMRQAGAIAAAARGLAGKMAVAGISTRELDRAVHDFIVGRGAIPTFLGYNGFPKSVCISVNDEVIHGIPGTRRLCDGDLVSIDVGATKDGFVGDCADTFIVGEGSVEACRLVEVTRQCFFEAMKHALPGKRVSDISRAVQECAENSGFSVVRDFVGHGVGERLHEDPEIPNYVQAPRRGADPRLIEGMTIAVEPMINAGRYGIRVMPDGWTIATRDGSLSAHYENTVLITRDGARILTQTE